MGAINLAGIWPIAVVAGMLLAGVEFGAREARAAATADDGTTPRTTWEHLSTNEQAAWDQAALDRAADLAPPLPDLDRGDTR